MNSRQYNLQPKSADGTQPSKISPPDHPLTVTIADLRSRASISRSEAYRLLAAGKLRAVKSGSRTLVLWQSVLEYVASLPAAEFTAPKGRIQ